MSARLSPDGMYYWDGQTWKSTLSPDGRFRWDGSAWTPAGAMMVTPYGLTARPQPEPTSWTKPLQIAIAGWYVWSILYVLAEPFWLGGVTRDIVNQSLLRQQQINPQVSPPPVPFTDVMSNVVSVSLWASAVFYSAIFLVILFGTWKRWTWIYYVVLVLLGLTALVTPFQLFSALVGSAGNQFQTFRPPVWLYIVNFVTALPAIALVIWMAIALFQRGPWAMRRPAWA